MKGEHMEGSIELQEQPAVPYHETAEDWLAARGIANVVLPSNLVNSSGQMVPCSVAEAMEHYHNMKMAHGK